MSLSMVRIQLYDLAVISDGLVIVPHGLICYPTVVVNRWVDGIQLDSLVEIENCPFVLALAAVGDSAVNVGLGRAGIQLNSPIEVTNGPVKLTLTYVGSSSVVVGLRSLGIQLDDPVKIGYRTVTVFLA